MTIPAYRLYLPILAEGARIEREVVFLRVSGCNRLQGYYYNRLFGKKALKRNRHKKRII
jgi:EAL domain-containing protein (putative c-di-GMP-specific phosphodiesterase class I)